MLLLLVLPVGLATWQLSFWEMMGLMINSPGKPFTIEIKKRWQEYTELYIKGLHDPDNHNGVITHQEPDLLECEVKWALGSITTNKASGGMAFQLSYFKS